MVIICAFFLFSCSKEEKIFARNISPSGNYIIEIHAYYPKGEKGVAKLIDNKTSEVIIKKEMSAVRYDFSVISWSDGEVTLDNFATWQLSRGEAGVGKQDVKYCYGDY